MVMRSIARILAIILLMLGIPTLLLVTFYASIWAFSNDGEAIPFAAFVTLLLALPGLYMAGCGAWLLYVFRGKVQRTPTVPIFETVAESPLLTDPGCPTILPFHDLG
jgi:hypothetical protein